MKTWVVGVNWWMTDYMRLMFQYAQSDLSGYPIFVAQNLRTLPLRDKQWLRRRHDQRLRHAHASRLVKLEKRNFSPLRCQTAAPNRAAVFFRSKSDHARHRIVCCRTATAPQRAEKFLRNSNALTRASAGLHCFDPEAILSERRYLYAQRSRHGRLDGCAVVWQRAGACLSGDARAAARRGPASRKPPMLSRCNWARPTPRRPLRKPKAED